MAEKKEFIPVLPSLQLGTKDLLETPTDIIWYIIRFSFENPGFTSSLNEASLVSFRVLEAEYGENKEILADNYAGKLSSAINNYFPGGNYKVSVLTEDINETTYKLILSVTDLEGKVVLPASNATVTEDSIELNLNRES